MKLRKHLGAILLTSCLSQMLALSATATDTQPTTPNATNSMASKDDLSAQKELFQVQLDAKKELLQKDIETQATRIDAFEKRIDDQNSRIGDIDSSVDRFTSATGLLGVLITVFLVGIGFWGYKTAKNDAKETAKEAASQWFETNHHKLISQMEELESRIVQAIQRIDEHEEDVAQRSNEFKERTNDLFEEQMKNYQAQLSQSTSAMKPQKRSSTDNSAIEQEAKKLKQKPESDYKFTDWNTRAFAAYSEGQLENAVFYWDKAISSPDIQPQAHAQTLLNKGVTLGQLNRNKDAIVVYDALITQFGTSEKLALQEQVAKAMNNKGVALGQLNRNDEEIAVYDALITQFGTSEKLVLREQVAKAMNNKGVVLGQLNRNDEEIAVYDALIIQFGTSEKLVLREQVAKATNNKGVVLGQLNHNKEAIAVYDSLITQFGTAEELALREQVAKAMNNKGYCLGQLNRHEEEIAVYDALITQFGTAEELALREQVAKAMFSKGYSLGQLNRSEEEIAAYDALITQFDPAEDLALRKQVAGALNGKGFNLLCMAKANWENRLMANEQLAKASDACKLAISKNSDNGIAHGNLAYISWLQGDAVAAEQHFRAGLASSTDGGEILYEGTLADFDIHPIEPDNGFRALVEKLWAEHQAKCAGTDT